MKSACTVCAIIFLATGLLGQTSTSPKPRKPKPAAPTVTAADVQALKDAIASQQAALAQLVVGRPIGLVEGTARGVDGPLHVFLRRVRDLTERLLGRGIDVGEGAGPALDEPAVDHHLGLEADLYSLSHVCHSLLSR